LREYHGLDADKPATNRFYVIEDASHSAEGYGPRWWSHLWRVRAKQMPASTEYQDILDRLAGDGQSLESLPPSDDPDACCDETIGDSVSNEEKLNEITDAIIAEAAKDVMCDPLWYEAQHLYVCIDPETREHQLIWFKTGDGNPPNGQALAGSGATKIEVDQCKLPWTGANQLLDSFIDNEATSTLDDGTVIDQRQALSKVIRAQPIEGEAQQVPTGTVSIPTVVVEDDTDTDTGLFSPDFSDEFE